MWQVISSEPSFEHLILRAGASALHRMILRAMRIIASFVSRASKRIWSALVSFLPRPLGGAEGMWTS